MTPKQALRAHIQEMHSPRNAPGERTSYAKLQHWHADQHHRYWTSHHHGPNPGPSARPPGWYTGADAVPIDKQRSY